VIDIQRRGQDAVTDSPSHGRASMTRQAAKAKQRTLSTAKNAKPKAASCRIPGSPSRFTRVRFCPADFFELCYNPAIA
jgi:hypothetical protein